MIILRKEDSNVSFEELVELIHLSFEERLQQGLKYTCSSISVAQYIKKVQDGVVFVAVDSNTNKLLGTSTIHIFKDKHHVCYGYIEYLAVAPGEKHQGIGSELLREQLSLLSSLGGRYVMSDTSVEAESSVRWHLKNGFKIFEFQSFPSTNYWSYIFIKYIDPSIELGSICLKFHYSISWVITRLVRDVNGNYTWAGRILDKIRKR